MMVNLLIKDINKTDLTILNSRAVELGLELCDYIKVILGERARSLSMHEIEDKETNLLEPIKDFLIQD